MDLKQDHSLTLLREIVFENAVRREKSESRATLLLANDPGIFEKFQRQARRAFRLLSDTGITQVILPGGIWGLSGVHAVAAKESGITYWTYDSGPGQLTLGRNGVCAHFADYPEAYAEAQRTVAHNPPLARYIVEETKRRLDIRRAGKDAFRLQPEKSLKVSGKFDLVVLLNYRADTAAMGRNLAFADVSSWIRSLVEWVQRRGDITMAIRQHPCERIPAFRSLENYDWLRTVAPGKIHFYGCEDAVNTYDLIDATRIVLPYTTRTGLEAALLGKRVVLATRCYYSCCSFIESAATSDKYFENLDRMLATSSPPSVGKDQAVAYFLAEHCLFADTVFTPIQADFRKWCAMKPAEMHRLEAYDQVLSCIENNENFLLQRFQTMIARQLEEPLNLA